MKNELLLMLSRLNFLFPNWLGIRFIRYKFFVRRNYRQYDNTARLLSIVNKTIKEVPYYKNLKLDSIKSIDTFKKGIPITNKDIVMRNWDDFISSELVKNKVIEGTTGGTSGKPLRLIIPKNRFIVELNTMNLLWGTVGWNGQLRAVIRNKHLKKDTTFEVNPFKKELIFDGFNTDPLYYEKIYTVIKKHRIQYIHAYPSSAYQFSLFLKNTQKDTSFIKAFLCGSESVTEIQSNLIQKELSIPIYNWYGHSEKLILGGPCENNDAVHIEPTYGYFELLDESGMEIKVPGQVGEIVGTSLHNTYMPLTRYRTGDYAEYVGDYCDKCKRHLTLIKNIQGRWDKNKIYLSDGSYVTITALNLHSELYLKIEGIQFVQKIRGELEIYIVKGESFNSETEKEFKLHFDQALHGKCTYEIIYVNEMQKEENGKFLPLRQFVKD